MFEDPKEIRSGTLTLIKTNNKYYGITCKHVIDLMKKKNEEVKLEFSKKFSLNIKDLENLKAFGLFTQTKNQLDLTSYKFFQPSSQYPDPNLDILITELDENFVKVTNKEFIDLDKNDIVPNNLNYAIAVGYPENLKYRKKVGDNYYISMPHCTVIAELQGTPTRSFTLHSNIDKKIDRNFSGMSGGPIFWNQSINFNLLGIIYESPNNQQNVFSENDIVISGELATPNIIKDWIKELFDNKTE